MGLVIPDLELRFLQAFNKKAKKEGNQFQFALGLSDEDALLILRKYKTEKDADATEARAAFLKAGRKSSPVARLITWGIAKWDGKSMVLDGKKNFPSGAKIKIRKFAVKFNLKSFVKVTCQVSGEEDVASKGDENEEQATLAEELAVKAIEDALKDVVDEINELDDESFEAEYNKLLEEERKERSKDILSLEAQLKDATPDSIQNHDIAQLLVQLDSLGDISDMTPPTLQLCVALCQTLLEKMGDDHPKRAKIQRDAQSALAHLTINEDNVLTSEQLAKLERLQTKTTAVFMQTENLKKFLVLAEDSRLTQIGRNPIKIDQALHFMESLQKLLRMLYRCVDEDERDNAVEVFKDVAETYVEESKTVRFNLLHSALDVRITALKELDLPIKELMQSFQD